MIIVGIDPGQKGAFLAMNENGEVVYQFVFRNNEDEEFDIKYFSDNVKDFLQKYDKESIIFYVEDVHSLFGMSAKSNFSFGKTCGMIESSIITLGYEINKVTPKVWQKEMLDGIEIIKKKDSNKNDVKAMSLKAQQQLFPNFNSMASSRSRKPHDGLIDALLIAEYARRKHINA